jgi:glycosyltransferase involved in cell wall biosynthesis
MRLGLLIYGSLETISGGFIYDRLLVEHLRAQGDEVEVVSLPWSAYGRGLLDNLRPALLRRLSRARWDLLLQDELVHPSFFLLNRRLRRLAPYPSVSVVHLLRSREPRPAWQNRLYEWVERRYLTSVDGFVYVSRTIRADVERLVGPGRPGVVAYPGGDRLPGEAAPEQIRARAADPGALRIISVANLIPRKELHTLIAALATLPREGWHLSVAGSLTLDPAYARRLFRQISQSGLNDQVSFLGILSPQDLAGRLAQSHLLAVPSSYEGLGIAYLEGMRFGLPAIASAAGAAHEVISHGRDGFLVPPGDAGALAKCLDLLIRDRARLTRMSLAAKEHASTHPTWRNSLSQVREFLHSFES